MFTFDLQSIPQRPGAPSIQGAFRTGAPARIPRGVGLRAA